MTSLKITSKQKLTWYMSQMIELLDNSLVKHYLSVSV